MEAAIQSLFPHERKELLAALRRDMRHELRRANADAASRSFHMANYRMTVRLLEVLNPRRCR